MGVEQLQGIVIGALAAISIVYTFQTRVPYPMWVLQIYDKPWLLLVLIVISLILLFKYPAVGAMLLLLCVAVWMDGILFARPLKQNGERDHITTTNMSPRKALEVYPYTEPLERRTIDTSGPSLEVVPLPEPLYPIFYGLNDVSSGPAPF